MNEFLEKLYSYEYFGTYLMIAIIVLLLLFVIILFFGKKDQKNREIEATKKLQQINSEDTFKENSVPQNLEVNTLGTTNLNDTIVVPNLENLNSTNMGIQNNVPEQPNNTVENLNMEVQPVNNDLTNMNNTPVEPITPEINNVNNYEPPVFNPNPVTAENNVNGINNFNSFSNPSPIEPPIVESEPIDSMPFNTMDSNVTVEPQLEINPVNFPEVNVNPNQDFYANLNKELNNENKPVLDRVEEKPFAFGDNVNSSNSSFNFNNNFSSTMDTNEVDIPTFNFDEIVRGIEESKKEQPAPVKKEEVNRGPEIFSSVYVKEKEELPTMKMETPEINDNDDIDLELPNLKKESSEPLEKPVLNDFNLDDLSGETYTINNN